MKYWLWLPGCRELLPVRTDAAEAIQSHRTSGERGTPPYQSAADTTDTSTWLTWDPLFNPQRRPASCFLFTVFSPFQIQSGRWARPRLSPPLWPSRYGRGRSEQTPQLLLPPGIAQSSSVQLMQLQKSTYFTLLKPVTWHTYIQACHTENLPSFSGFY